MMSWEDIGRNEAIRELAKEIRAVRTQKTLRDEFAMAMLPALFAAAHDKPNAWGPDQLAPQAYQFADAMMKAREQK